LSYAAKYTEPSWPIAGDEVMPFVADAIRQRHFWTPPAVSA
jgi:hypothetical protein